MRRTKTKVVIAILACAAMVGPAEARPRLFRVIGALVAAPVALLAAAAYSRPYRIRRTQAPRRVSTVVTDRRAESGWAGSVFWPDASDDLFGYVFGLPGAADRFWSYGYNDVLDAMFVTTNLQGKRTQSSSSARVADTATGSVQPWRDLCGQPRSDIDELVERLRTRLEPTPEQSPAIEALRDALMHANARIAAACPDDRTAEAPERMELMATRLMAIRLAASTVLPPLRRLYALLDDRQKSLFNAVEAGTPQTVNAPVNVSTASVGCTDKADEWPTAQIARRLAPKGAQLEELETLRLTAASFGSFVASACKASTASNPIERLEAARQRVNVIRYAVIHIRPSLNAFYASLNATQRVRFGTLGR